MKNYAVAVLLGAVGGGLLVVMATKAIPKMVAKMMQNMVSWMNESGHDPSEM